MGFKLFDFTCPECGYQGEHLTADGTKECPVCGKLMRKQVSAPQGVQINGVIATCSQVKK